MTQVSSYFEPLVLAAVGVVSKLMNHQQQMNLLDQTKTLAESALQMLYAAKEGGGNPKVSVSGAGWGWGRYRGRGESPPSKEEGGDLRGPVGRKLWVPLIQAVADF